MKGRRREMHRYLRSGWSPVSRSSNSVWQRIRLSHEGLPLVVRQLLWLQVGLWLLGLLFQSQLAGVLGWIWLSAPDVMAGRLWQLVTYLPFHFPRDLFGLLFDILMLWSLGGLFARRWKRSHFLLFYLAGGIGGAAFNVVLYLLFAGVFATPVLGTSGSTFALFAAFWLLFGETPVSVFGSNPIKGKWVFFAILALESIFFIAGTNPFFGVQLGGIATGWLLVTGRWRPGRLVGRASQSWNRLRKRMDRQRRRLRVVH